MGIDPTALAELNRESYINLATFRRSGKAVETAVWFAARDGLLYVFTEAKSGKVKRLHNGDKIRVAACNARGRVHGDWIEGRGRRIDDAAVVENAYRALLEKYGWQMRLTDFFSRLFGRIEGRAILELEI